MNVSISKRLRIVEGDATITNDIAVSLDIDPAFHPAMTVDQLSAKALSLYEQLRNGKTE